MMNVTHPLYFTLSAYFDTGRLKYLYFMIVLCLYVCIIGANLLLIVVICVNRTLHEPMYLFLCSLFVNELYGSSGLFPLILVQILSDSHTVSAPLCFLQIFVIYSYANIEFSNLAIMSYDRFVAICSPLQYNTYMTFHRIAKLMVFIWLYPFIEVAVLISLSAPLQLCGHVIPKVYCDNYNIVKLACYDTTINNIYGILYMFTVIMFIIGLIVYSYIRILKVCFSGSKQTRQKALQTCMPHLVSLINFSSGAFFEVMQSRFNMSGLPSMTRIILSLYFLTCQPLLNPLLYGLQMSKLRVLCRQFVLQKT